MPGGGARGVGIMVHAGILRLALAGAGAAAAAQTTVA